MAKKSRKRVARYQRDQSGCMWGLISIFDFRNGRSQKLLPDKKRGSKRLDAAAYANITLESLTDACEVCNDVNGSVRSETSSRDMSKLSVKELMDEEMLGEEDQKKEESVTNGEAKPNTKVDGGYIKKNRRWMRNKMSLDLDSSGFVAAHDLVTERPRHRKHKSCSSVDLNVIVEELCNRIHQKDTDCERHEQDSESVIQSIEEDPSVIEKKLWDSTKVLVNHFTNANGSTKDGKIQPSKELTDALQILNSNKDLFLKLLQDPSSQLVRQIQSSQDIQVEEGKFKVLTGSDMLEHDMGNGKQHNFFWRRFKGLEKNSSRKTGTAEDIDRIVVLKPGSQSSGLSDTNTPCSSLPGSPRIKGDKDHNERAFSLFSFSEFKRKLKHAMRKEQHGMSHQPSDGQPYLANRDKKIGAETIPASPSRDHFFIERIPKTSGGVKVDKAGKLRDDSALTPEQRVSNIYIEAKKHLADIVGNSDIHEDNSGKRRPRSLGRILAYSGYSSPICSPRTEGDMKLSPKGESQTNDEKKTSQDIQASNVGDASQVEQESESEPCIATDLLIHEAEVPNSDPCILDGLPHDSDIDKSIHEAEFPAFEVLADSGRSSDAESQKEGDWTNNSFEQSSPEAIKKSEQVGSCSTCFEKEKLWPCLGVSC
ncbi:30S ribosomal protein S2 [Bienertia sinuspersici]